MLFFPSRTHTHTHTHTHTYIYAYTQCTKRWAEDRFLMSSSSLPDTLSFQGLLSSNASVSPFYAFHSIFLPYLTSDVWIGNSAHTGNFSFRGSICWRAVLDDLLHGIYVHGVSYSLQSASDMRYGRNIE